MASLQPGSRFGDYEVLRLLGHGGMAEVYLARTEAEAEPVALKVVLAQFADDPVFRRRFEREARLAQRVEHPHVVAVRTAGEVDGALFLASDYVAGRDLGAVLAQSGPLDPAWAALIVGQIGEGLAAAAELELIHRDVKPGNVFVREQRGSPYALLGDFGLSKEVGSTSGLTATGQWVGTIDYASPEQLQASALDHRTDVYSLGAVLHRTLTNEVPYPRPRAVATVLAHITDPVPCPSSVEPAVPPAFDAIVARAMAKDPEDRYPSTAAMAVDLGEAAAGLAPPPAWEDAAVAAAAPPVASGDPTVAASPESARMRPEIAVDRVITRAEPNDQGDP